MESGRQCQLRPNQVLGGKQPPVQLGTAASPLLPNMKRLGGHLEVEVARGSRRKKANAPKDEGRIAREWGMLMRCNAAEATRKPSTIPSSSLRRPIEAFRQLVGPPVPRVPRTNCVFRLPIPMWRSEATEVAPNQKSPAEGHSRDRAGPALARHLRCQEGEEEPNARKRLGWHQVTPAVRGEGQSRQRQT